MSRQRKDLWGAALHVVESLRNAGYVALLAGGCVRDRLLNHPPKDYDVATNATPDRVLTLFPRARKVGVQFGVVLVRRFGQDIEVATFRTDGPYADGRHPDNVTFGSDVEDARRRDFTINGLFYDPLEDRVIDYVGGRDDLERRLIRTIGDAEARFSEDHLRVLRAVRFAARLGFEIEPDTFSAMQKCAPRLSAVSPERVWIELREILTDPHRGRGWTLLLSSGLRRHLSAAWPPDEALDSLVLGRLNALPDEQTEPALSLAAVLCDRNESDVAKICRSLRLSNQLGSTVGWLVRALPGVRNDAPLDLADLKLLMAHPSWSNLLILLRADLSARGEALSLCTRLSERAGSIAPADVAPPPLVTGHDLSELGLEPGPRFGEILDAVYRAQLNDEVRTRETAIAMVRSMMEE